MAAPSTILIVDDEERNRRLLEVLLQPEGYVTVGAADARAALAAVAEQQIDLILLDVMMPGMNGYELASILKAHPLTKSIPIIMVTAHVDRETRLAALEAGVEEFLTKPVDRAELWLRVRNLLRLKEYGDFLSDYSGVLEQQVAERSSDLQRFRMAMDTAADGIFLIDQATMKFVEVNATASNMTGYSRSELMQLGPADLASATAVELAPIYAAIVAGDTTDSATRTQIRRKNGTSFPVELHRHARRSDDDWIIVAVVRDITDRVAVEAQLQHLAHFDALTGLPNRTLFYETLKNTIQVASRHDWRVAVMFLDVDHFKNVNDTLGHVAGDHLLAQLAQRLVGCVRLRDTVGRLGGDEFALILTMETDERGAAAVATNIRAALLEPFHLAGSHVSVTASIGITMYPADGTKPATLVKYADTAMYGAKQAGRDTFRFFKPQMNSDLVVRLRLEQALRKAIDKDEFVLHYQPKVRLNDGRIVGLEALLRWERPGHGLVPPNEFIPVLEETGMIREVGNWVIEQACRQIAEWAGNDIGLMQIAVNVSGRQFFDSDLDANVGESLTTHGVCANSLELELTESSLMADTERTVATLRKLRARGVRVSIDDFGTGYSCLAYLRQFPIDKLKIDIAFIRGITSNPADATMAETIIRMAHGLKMDAIAEGVETAAQLKHLMRLGCDQIQGYYFSRPLPVADLEQLLRAGTCLAIPEELASHPRATVLVVGQDAKTLTSLERLFGQDGYQVLTAMSAVEGLDLLALHQVHVIVCDDDPPMHEAPAFLPRLRALYPDSLRIALSGRTASRDLIASINDAALHGFHAKPWDDDALRHNVREAIQQHRGRVDTD